MKSSPLALLGYRKFGSLRVVRSEQGAQWFVAEGVCRGLDLGLASGARGLDGDEKDLGDA